MRANACRRRRNKRKHKEKEKKFKKRNKKKKKKKIESKRGRIGVLREHNRKQREIFIEKLILAMKIVVQSAEQVHSGLDASGVMSIGCVLSATPSRR